MPALSFQEMWLDALLSGRKKQTTRATDRIKVGDIVHIYNQQRKRIADKPLRKMTPEGLERECIRSYPLIRPDIMRGEGHAHFIGKVKITDVFGIHPCWMSIEELDMWAWQDGFRNFIDADKWFTKNYGDDWMNRTWYVILWNEWLERYFLADGE